MESEIIWSEDMDKVYGTKQSFENSNDFANKASEEYTKLTGNACLISDVGIKCCICTEEGLESETIIPLDETDIEIKTFYIADVEKVEV